MKHRFVGEIKGNLIIFNCPECDYSAVNDWKNNKFIVIDKGDETAFHYGNSEIPMVGKVKIIEVKQAEDSRMNVYKEFFKDD